MEMIGVLLYLVFGVLSLVLFFKVWGMCNNIKKMSDTFVGLVEEKKNQERKERECFMSSLKRKYDIEIGSSVIIIESGIRARVKDIRNNRIECYSNQYTIFEGAFKPDEIKKDN